MKTLERSLIFAIAFNCCLLGVAFGKEMLRSFNESIAHNLFATDLYVAVAANRLAANVVISPAAVQAALALAYCGAKGQTATEIANGARLEANNAEEVIESYRIYQQSYGKENALRLMSAFYINENLEFKGKFKELAKKSLDAMVEKADFHPPYNKRTAERINKVIGDKTDGKITDLLKAETLNDRTEGILITAATFNAPWQTAFRNDRTTTRSFSDGGHRSYNIPTMWTLNSFRYGQLNQLDATAVELPYQNTDYVMILLLPQNKNGLENLIQRLAGQNLISLLDANLSRRKIEVYLPKFSVGFGISLQEPLKQLGISTMFTRSGDFSNLYRMFVNYYLNSFDHGAHVEVKEDGAQPPLDPTGGLKSVFVDLKQFNADHPFVFAIRHKESIIFMGHISNFA